MDAVKYLNEQNRMCNSFVVGCNGKVYKLYKAKEINNCMSFDDLNCSYKDRMIKKLKTNDGEQIDMLKKGASK